MLSSRTVLVVDDDENDRLFVRVAFQEAGVSNPIQELGDGQEAIKYLKGETPYADRELFPLPCLMLLDLKMSRCDGFAVLAWRKNARTLAHFPVVVLSSSGLDVDIRKAMELGADAYSIKPHQLGYLVTMAKELRTRWLEPEPKPTVTFCEI